MAKKPSTLKTHWWADWTQLNYKFRAHDSSYHKPIDLYLRLSYPGVIKVGIGRRDSERTVLDDQLPGAAAYTIEQALLWGIRKAGYTTCGKEYCEELPGGLAIWAPTETFFDPYGRLQRLVPMAVELLKIEFEDRLRSDIWNDVFLMEASVENNDMFW